MSARPMLPGGLRRRLARWFGRRPFTVRAGRPVISFTFDDFPRSALHTAGAMLETHGLAGTYYCSLGLAGRRIATGEIFHEADLRDLVARQHELGCHTFDHVPSWETTPAAFEASSARNMAALAQLLPGVACRSLSYPISYPRPDTKRRAGRRFACCRGGGQQPNSGNVDLNYLSAFFIEQARDRPNAIEQVIADNARLGGWLIFATHDVTENPTRFGCTPRLFETVLHQALASGAEILPVFSALQALRARA